MIQALQDYIQREVLFQSSDRLLLAVSGGVDSMLLAQLLWEAEYDLGIIHCNFQLRGAASDADEELVRSWAEEHQCPFYIRHFDTPQLVEQRTESIQSLARKLRYAFFEEIRKEAGYDYIVTAHHADDQVETMLLQLAKGCGIRGLRGMLPKNDRKVVRPLLFSSKSNIRSFAQLKQIPFREDASNQESYYQRNLLRQQVLPTLRQINPQLGQTFQANSQRFRETEWLYKQGIERLQKQLLRPQEDATALAIAQLEQIGAPISFLHEWLSPLGFSSEQIHQIWEGRTGKPGAQYQSEAHELLRDRGQWLLRSKTATGSRKVIRDQSIQLPEGRLELHIQKPPFEFEKNPQVAYFDLEQLQFPLYLKHWEQGDTFAPFGMEGKHKKLSDFFIDEKYDRFQKEKQWLLCSGDAIIWVVGKRSDGRFKVQATTKMAVKIQWYPLNEAGPVQ